jgi:type IV secretory pathway VirB4 component
MAKDGTAAQEFVPVHDVRDGVVILKDGSLHSMLMASSMNFALKSADEQQSILTQFQNFLNSIEFQVQIFIQSRELDIRPYLQLLEDRYEKQKNDLMRIQTREYMKFIQSFTEGADIMSKHFFIVVSYSPPPSFSSSSGVLGSIKETLGLGDGDDGGEAAERSFQEYKTQLEQRMSVVEQGLTSTGVRVVPLGTEETIELFYKELNPGELKKPMTFDQ